MDTGNMEADTTAGTIRASSDRFVAVVRPMSGLWPRSRALLARDAVIPTPTIFFFFFFFCFFFFLTST